jgi:diguanylate cyclase (GGDEF)-like protein
MGVTEGNRDGSEGDFETMPVSQTSAVKDAEKCKVNAKNPANNMPSAWIYPVVILLILPDFYFLKPLPYYIAGIATAVFLRLLSSSLYKKGHEAFACTMVIIAPLMAFAIPCLLAPAGPAMPVMPFFGFLAAVVMQSGYMMHNSKSPFVIAGVSSALVWIYLIRHCLFWGYSAYQAPFLLYGSVGLVISLLYFVVAFLTWINATRTSDALLNAGENMVMRKLYEELQESHRELEDRNERMLEQAKAMAEMNDQLIAMQAELASNNSQLEEMNAKLEEQATTDSLTGLANRRMFQESLRKCVSQALRHQQPLSLIMLDVDYFKKFNDEHGHLTGDQVLKHIADILKNAVRMGDIVARYGGEEFAIILNHAEPNTAQVVAERIRQNVEKNGVLGLPLTISSGVSYLHSGIIDPEELVEMADNALYDAKRLGRNRVETCPIPINAKLPPMSNDFRTNEDRDLAEIPTNSKDNPEFVNSVGFDPFGGVEGLLQEPAGAILATLLSALDLRDAETHGHSLRVSRYAMRVACAMASMYQRKHFRSGMAPLITPSDLRDIALGSLFHDIGKIRLPDYILRKPGRLTDEELAMMRRHPIVGAELICEFPLLIPALPIVLHHHERWDGTGYPDNLTGNSIPLSARIFTICDAFDAITTDRPYRKALSITDARQIINDQAGKQFDPLVVEAFNTITDEEWIQLSNNKTDTINYPLAA